MYQTNEPSPDEYFPTVESFPDFNGEKREFVIDLHVQARGYFLRAREKRSSEHEGGYKFAAYSPSDPFFALGVLRGKIRKGLATRYLVEEEERLSLTHDRLKGHITFRGVVVDGEFISLPELSTILETYEGFQFSLEIADPFEDL
jgi:hypothetical protein